MKNAFSIFFCTALVLVSDAYAGTFKVDKKLSWITVDGHATGHDFTGTLKDYVVKGSGNSGTLKPIAFDLDWKFKDLDTKDADRNAKMIEWLKDKNPAGSYKFTKSWIDKDGRQWAMGTLRIHGVSDRITFPFTVKQKDGQVIVDGSATMDYENFKLPIIRTMVFLKVDPKLKVKFHMVGKLE